MKNAIEIYFSVEELKQLEAKVSGQTLVEFCRNAALGQSSRNRISRSRRLVSNFFQLSSSSCALVGGILLASKTQESSFGFLYLALSSSQLLLASILTRDWTMFLYSASLFIFVDCLGVYRWLLS